MEETLKNPESELKGNASGNAEDSEGGSSFLIYRLIALADQNRSTAALIGCVLLITLLDIIFDRFLFEPYVSLIETLSGSKPGEFAEVDIGFAPEVWQAILAMVLGTLILVISIASQSIPKLIDLYMKDLTSLIYVWFLIASGAHARSYQTLWRNRFGEGIQQGFQLSFFDVFLRHRCFSLYLFHSPLYETNQHYRQNIRQQHGSD